ncbi:MAG: TolC family protein [Immundisolibacteraceae bacterium]|nr:TolC family protein [Immundisolibacteraceae bacterium]
MGLLFLVMPLQAQLTQVAVDQQQRPDKPNELSLSSAVALALKDNPGLAQFQARYQALQQIPEQQGTLPDPVLSLNALNLPTDTLHVGQEAMTQLQIGISQALPYPGKLKLREQASDFDAQAAGHSVAEWGNQLVANVKRSWWQLYYLDRSLLTINRNQALLRNFVQVARTKYEVAEGLQQDLLLAQLELSKLIDQRIQLQALRRSQAIKLNRLMNRPVGAAVQLATRVAETMPLIADRAELIRRAQKARPLLMQVADQLDAAKSRLQLANRDRYPDFKLGLSYGDRSGRSPGGGSRPDLVSVMFSVNLPLNRDSRQHKAVKQHAHQLSETRFGQQDKRAQVEGEIAQAVSEYQRAQQQFVLFQTGILPQARQTVASMLAGYQVDQVDFLNLVRAQLTQFNYELSYWRALVEANQALAQIVAAVGEENIYE